jgi:hypothetical protein
MIMMTMIVIVVAYDQLIQLYDSSTTQDCWTVRTVDTPEGSQMVHGHASGDDSVDEDDDYDSDGDDDFGDNYDDDNIDVW